jgi:hypothetical protein
MSRAWESGFSTIRLCSSFVSEAGLWFGLPTLFEYPMESEVRASLSGMGIKIRAIRLIRRRWAIRKLTSEMTRICVVRMAKKPEDSLAFSHHFRHVFELNIWFSNNILHPSTRNPIYIMIFVHHPFNDGSVSNLICSMRSSEVFFPDSIIWTSKSQIHRQTFQLQHAADSTSDSIIALSAQSKSTIGLKLNAVAVIHPFQWISFSGNHHNFSSNSTTPNCRIWLRNQQRCCCLKTAGNEDGEIGCLTRWINSRPWSVAILR